VGRPAARGQSPGCYRIANVEVEIGVTTNTTGTGPYAALAGGVGAVDRAGGRRRGA
jgi:hypothetical protein